jgi:hypothetical protein
MSVGDYHSEEEIACLFARVRRNEDVTDELLGKFPIAAAYPIWQANRLKIETINILTAIAQSVDASQTVAVGLAISCVLPPYCFQEITPAYSPLRAGYACLATDHCHHASICRRGADPAALAASTRYSGVWKAASISVAASAVEPSSMWTVAGLPDADDVLGWVVVCSTGTVASGSVVFVTEAVVRGVLDPEIALLIVLSKILCQPEIWIDNGTAAIFAAAFERRLMRRQQLTLPPVIA